MATASEAEHDKGPAGQVTEAGVRNMERPTVAFVLSLIAGLVILAGSAMGMAFLFPSAPYYGYGPYYGGTMGGFGFGGAGWFYWSAVVGIVSGVMVLIGAIMLYSQPRRAMAWGIVILAFSIVSFLGMGGFFLGAILGIIGGILALTYGSSSTRAVAPGKQ